MNDKMIIQLYFERNEKAIEKTAEKYGSYCHSISQNILDNREDAQECVNDTYLRAWNTIPPTVPRVLQAFLARIVRNLSFNRYNMNKAEKRGGGQIRLVLDELEECADETSVESEAGKKELTQALNSFLKSLPVKQRDMFMCRYWYSDSISQIAERFNMTENNVSVTLNRLRKKLGKYLDERGIQ